MKIVQRTIRAFLVVIIIGVFPIEFQSRAEASDSDSSLTKFEINQRGLLHIKHLKNAYMEGSREKLASYLNAWVHWTQPVTREELDRKLPFDRHANDIYHLLHRPTNLRWFTKWFPGKRPEPPFYKKILTYIGVLDDGNWAEKIYEEAQYSLIQNEVEIYIVGTLPKPDDRSFDTERGFEKQMKEAITHVRILDFRPPVKPHGRTQVYLVPSLKGILEKFLESKKVLSNETGLQSTHKDSLANRRLEFLNRELKILRSHWEGWHFETHPLIERVVFNRDLSKAIAEYRIKYAGGRAYLERTADGWELMSAGLTWIE
ncbi:MAG: hypothetical protein OYM47_14955 [Gemmatimonadota bacterium]|nr:hypothetical protein [Gemmatimonadota bacterium]